MLFRITESNVPPMLSSAYEFIESKGVQALMAATGRADGAVRLWKHRNNIPREAWPDLLKAFPDELSLDDLLRIEQPRKPKARKRARAA